MESAAEVGNEWGVKTARNSEDGGDREEGSGGDGGEGDGANEIRLGNVPADDPPSSHASSALALLSATYPEHLPWATVSFGSSQPWFLTRTTAILH